MNKFLCFIFAGTAISLIIWNTTQIENNKAISHYSNSGLFCDQSALFSYARGPSDIVYFPVLKSVIHHTYN
jgi:hypothetical protein